MLQIQCVLELILAGLLLHLLYNEQIRIATFFIRNLNTQEDEEFDILTVCPIYTSCSL